MQIVINHLTRMQTGFICVAGVSTKSRKHIRPCLPDRGRLTEAMWRKNGGVFDIGAVIEIGPTANQSAPPEVEDRIFREVNLAPVEDMDPEDFWDLLVEQSEQSLEAIFGPELQQVWRGYATDEGQGQASLGCFMPPTSPNLYVDGYGKLKMDVQNGDFVARLSVADRRLHDEQRQPREKLVSRLAKRITSGEAIILSVGLARAFVAPNDDRRRHWLQVNNIYLHDDPEWTASTLRSD